MTRLAIIDYGSGNVRSVQRALEAAANRHEIRLDIVLTDEPARIRQADRIVLPGVGHFADCAAGLASRPGVTEALTETVFRSKRPFLGICVGMQLLATRGTEHGFTPGLGWIPGDCIRLQPSDPALKIPHMGWNELEPCAAHPLLDGIAAGAHAYFVHSYHVVAGDPADVVATASYGGAVTAMVARGNVAGAQFHPEKSQAAGLRLLANFLRWRP
jgi:glutamine amidotransferase